MIRGGIAEVAAGGIAEPREIAHRHRTIESVGDAQLIGEFLRCIRRQDRDKRIAGRDVHQEKAYQRDADDDRDHIDDASDDVDEHN